MEKGDAVIVTPCVPWALWIMFTHPEGQGCVAGGSVTGSALLCRLLNVLEVIAPFKHFNKLREFVQMKLPPGFPVKLGKSTQQLLGLYLSRILGWKSPLSPAIPHGTAPCAPEPHLHSFEIPPGMGMLENPFQEKCSQISNPDLNVHLFLQYVQKVFCGVLGKNPHLGMCY